MQSTPKRKMTTPGLGLGDTGKREKVTIREEDAPPESRQNISCPDRIAPDALASRETIRTSTDSSQPPQSGPAKKTTPRPSPVRVDDFSGAAMKIASRGRPSSAPRLARAKLDASKAPLDSQSAYVLSLVDGNTALEGIADITGISVERVTQIIERLERLGFVAAH